MYSQPGGFGVTSGTRETVIVELKIFSGATQPSVLAGSVTELASTVRVSSGPGAGMKLDVENPAEAHRSRAPATDRSFTTGTVRQLFAGGGGGGAGGPVGHAARQPELIGNAALEETLTVPPTTALMTGVRILKLQLRLTRTSSPGVLLGPKIGAAPAFVWVQLIPLTFAAIKSAYSVPLFQSFGCIAA